MTARILPREEWSRLADTDLAPALPYLPLTAKVLVVEHLDRIVACWSLALYPHCEGLWVAPEHRSRGVAGRHLYDLLCHHAAADGHLAVLTAALTPEVEALITHAGGQQLPGTHWVLPIGGR